MRLLILFCLIAFTSCGYFSKKMNEAFKEGSVQIEKEADSLKGVLLTVRAEREPSAKLDSLYSLGFGLIELNDSAVANTSYNTTYTQQLSYFRNYVIHNFEYDDQVCSMLPMLNMGQKMGGQSMPMGLDGAVAMMQNSAKTSILHILIICTAQQPVKGG